MTDDQVANWENKIKDSLLRRDSTVESITSSLQSDFQKVIPYKGKGYSLASFGITSPDYTEKGLLHIDGDADDVTTASKKNKLKEAITENPDAVIQTFTQMAGDLYKDLSDKMKSTTLRSALTFYNDKEIKKTLDDYDDDISAMEDRLSDMETRYYKQFSSMESAMQKWNSQGSYLTSLLGGSSKQ
jgi:flagellar hook-associated protein 2